MTSDTFRPELQGLRAVAVLLVYVFHLETGLLSGGYVGVDAFFVLSGYLITGSLVSELARTGRIDFFGFYERRFRRLLPTAALVLLAIVLTAGILPRDRWPSISREVIASSVYLENWFLAHHSVDYLAVDNSPGPVQHYWSLSVEEQFYFVWPLFLVCAVALLKRLTGSARRACCLAIALALLLSFGASAAAALKPKVGDYFATHLRIWELALGGLIAAIGRDGFRFASGRLAPWLQGVGLAMLLGAGVVFSSVTVFPGYAALLPAVGTGLVMMVTGVPRHPQRNLLLDNAPMRWIGDISYSFYLWHWPVIVYAKALNGGSLGWPLAVLVTLVVLALSHLTKIHVEDRFRVGHGPAVAVRPARRWRTAGIVVAAIGVPILLSVSLLAFLAFDTRRLRTQVLDARDYPGGASLLASAPPPDEPYFPSASRVTLDIPDIYDGDCSLPYGASRIQSCPRGAPAGTLKVALVGDSHMAQWSPAFDLAGKKNGWTIIPLTKSSCPLVATRLTHFDAQSCAEWSESVWKRLADDPPDVIVTTLYLDGEISQLASDDLRRQAVQGALSRLAILSPHVVVLRDTPHVEADPLAALSGPGRQPVTLPMQSREPGSDVLAAAAAATGGATFLDMNDLICPGGACRTVIGNVVVWRDTHHITAHYAASLGVPLADRMKRSLDSASSGR